MFAIARIISFFLRIDFRSDQSPGDVPSFMAAFGNLLGPAIVGFGPVDQLLSKIVEFPLIRKCYGLNLLRFYLLFCSFFPPQVPINLLAPFVLFISRGDRSSGVVFP